MNTEPKRNQKQDLDDVIRALLPAEDDTITVPENLYADLMARFDHWMAEQSTDVADPIDDIPPPEATPITPSVYVVSENDETKTTVGKNLRPRVSRFRLASWITGGAIAIAIVSIAIFMLLQDTKLGDDDHAIAEVYFKSGGVNMGVTSPPDRVLVTFKASPESMGFVCLVKIRGSQFEVWPGPKGRCPVVEPGRENVVYEPILHREWDRILLVVSPHPDANILAKAVSSGRFSEVPPNDVNSLRRLITSLLVQSETDKVTVKEIRWKTDAQP